MKRFILALIGLVLAGCQAKDKPPATPPGGIAPNDVQLLAACREPAAASGGKRLRLGELVHPEQLAVERASLRFAPGGRCNLARRRKSCQRS